MKKSNQFFNIFENAYGNFSWNGKLAQKLGRTRLQVRDKECDYNTNMQEAVSNIMPDLDSLSNDDLSTCRGNLKALD